MPSLAKSNEFFMQRALALALRGAGRVSPNPLVGCVIVKGNKIISEGFHGKFGGPHAEMVLRLGRHQVHHHLSDFLYL